MLLTNQGELSDEEIFILTKFRNFHNHEEIVKSGRGGKSIKKRYLITYKLSK